MWPRKILNEEAGNDVTEVLCVSSDSDVSFCYPAFEFLGPNFLLTDTGCMVLWWT